MTDRELLELAAKAAGIPIHVWGLQGKESVADMSDPSNHKRWNPLTDDGDALRLAVKLGMFIEIDRPAQRVSALPEQDEIEFSRERFGKDSEAATRRAIVRAAAEIGKVMP